MGVGQRGLSADEAAIRATVGDRTFGLGRDYARGGAVQGVRVSEGGRVASGRVSGSARTPYSATAAVRRDASGAIAAFVGTCTCPVRAYCKHAVAVALCAFVPSVTQDLDRPALRLAPAPVSELAGWEETLQALTRAAGTRGVVEQHVDTRAGVALQFEVLPATAHEPPSVLLRPVVPGRTGWVRTGIGWANLHSLRYSGRAAQAGHVRLLEELLALYSGGQARDLYGYRDQRMALELFRTRRVWDLLREMDGTGLPLVQAGRGGAVTARDVSAAVGFDLTQGADGVTITPRLLLDGAPLPAHGPWLVGAPAHGVAWLDGDVLHLASLVSAPGVDVAAVLAAPVVTVPDQAQERLLADYVPRLRRLATVLSSDASVVLPEPTPPTLALRAEYRDGHHVALSWSWVHTEGAGRRVESMSPDSLRLAPADDAMAMRRLLARVVDIARPVPALLDEDSLAPQRLLAGLATATFTEQVLPALRALDGVEVDVAGEPADYREITEAPVITFGGEPEGRDWYDLTVSVTVDGEQVPFLALFEALARGDEHLILPGGAWFALDRPEFTQLAWLIEESRALLDAPAGTVRVGRLQAGVWDDLERLGIVDAQADAWRGATRALSTIDRIPEQPVPSGLRAELRSYQFDGFTWLAFLFEHGLGGVLADEMGLGKTVQTLALMCHVQEKGLADAPFLVVAPTSVVHNWASEAARFAPGLVVRTITGTERRRGRALADVVEGADLVITSYTLFRLEHAAYTRLPWAGLVLDEAQFAKNHESRAYSCAKSLDTGFKLAVTGTPLENTMMELWSLLSITAPGLFPKPAAFETYYRRPIEREHDTDRLEQLRTRVRPLMLRRTKAQVLDDLPDKQEQVLELDLAPRHRRVYQTYLQRERQKVLGMLGDLEKNRFAIFRSLTLLRQACLDVALIDPAHAGVPSTKLDALLDQLTELASEGHRAVVFSQFTRFLDLARARLEAAGIDHCYLDGKTTNRAEVIDRFKNGTAPVFLISLKAGGFGLTLTEADYCFLLDPWWNPATEAQAVDRLHRIGQPRKVMVYRMVARDTIEEKVMALKAGKAALFDAVMDASGVTSGALTAADIRGLLE